MFCTANDVRVLSDEFNATTSPTATDDINVIIEKADLKILDDLSGIYSYETLTGITPVPNAIKEMSINKTASILFAKLFSINEQTMVKINYWDSVYTKNLKDIRNGDIKITESDYSEVSTRISSVSNKTEAQKSFGDDPFGGTGAFTSRELGRFM